MKYILFYIIILLSNIIQGITGFAGTILAMPFSLALVGFDVAKPVLNVLGLLAGAYVLLTHGKHVNWKELKKIIVVMAAGILAGILLKSLLIGQEGALYMLLGIFIMGMAVHGGCRMRKPKALDSSVRKVRGSAGGVGASMKSYAMLAGAGIIHGMFVCGGPLLIGYLSNAIKDKVSFRATISTVWVVLNTMIMIDDIRMGLWNMELITTQAAAIPFLILGMVIGGRLYKTMSQAVFMKITYILLFLSGLSLLGRVG